MSDRSPTKSKATAPVYLDVLQQQARNHSGSPLDMFSKCGVVHFDHLESMSGFDLQKDINSST